MTAHPGTRSIDGTLISGADLARLAAEEELHAEQQRRAVWVVASSAHDADDCRKLLELLGLTTDIVTAARRQLPSATKPHGKSGVAA